MKLHTFRKFFCLLLLSFGLFVSQEGFALNFSDFGIGKPKVGACSSEDLPKLLDIAKLKETAIELKYQRKYCEAARYFLKIMIESNRANDYSWAWSERIESFFFQYDYESVWTEAEQFLTERSGSEYEWKVHFTLIKAVHELAIEKPVMGNIWFQYSLGISAEQLDKNAFKNKYSLRSFIEKYPDKEEVKLVLPWLLELQQNYSQDYLKQARMDRMRRDYVPAIVKYKFLLQQGPSFKEFGVVLFEAIQTLSEFSFFADDEKIVSTKKLSIWLMTTEDQITTETRINLKGQLDQEAKALYFMMLQKLPNDPWTEKAKHEFAFSN